jgi:hypothetical protein
VVARSIFVATAFLSLLLGQSVATRSKLSDYSVHAELPHLQLGAEYLIHRIPTEAREFQADDFLVVEVAVFPADEERVRISRTNFTLRLNDKKILDSVPRSVVATALTYADLQQRRNLSADPGLPDGAAVPGAPPVPGRFPGDPIGPPSERTSQSGGPNDAYGVDHERNMPIEQALDRVALPEGQLKTAVKGLLFFRFDGKLKSIRSLELVYTDQSGAQPALALIKPPVNK